MRFSVKDAERSLRLITGSTSGYANQVERKLGQLRSELDYADVDEILAGGLHEYLDGFQVKLNEIGGAVYENFFAL